MSPLVGWCPLYLVLLENVLEDTFPAADGRVFQQEVKQQGVLKLYVWGTVDGGVGDVVSPVGFQKLHRMVQVDGIRHSTNKTAFLD